MTESVFQFTVKSSSPELTFKFVFDGQEIFHGAVGSQTFSHQFLDNDQEHTIEFYLEGKTVEHTVVNDNGAIINDHVLEINDMTLEGVALDQIFYSKNQYYHSFNDTSKDLIEDKFYGIMGCNGRVEFKFTSPVYLWFLDNI